MNENYTYLPILIDLKQFRALVVGAGNIAIRKINNLLSFNGDVTVLAPEFRDEIQKLAHDNKIKLIKRKYKTNDVKNYNLVFCATNDECVDKIVRRDCERLGILLNVADVPELCNFIMPASIQKGALTVSIASQGKAPFYVRKTKKDIDNFLPPHTSDIVKIANVFRQKMILDGIYYNVGQREKLIKSFFKLDLEKILSVDGYEKALATAIKLIDEVRYNKE